MCRFGLLACCACRALAEAGAKGLPCAAAQHCCRRYCLPLPAARRGVAAGAATCHTTAVKAKRAPCACQACCRSPPSISAKTQSRPCTATQHKGTKIQQRNKIESKSNARRARGGWGLHSRRIPVQKLNPPWEIPNPRQVEKRGEGERTTQERRGAALPFLRQGKEKKRKQREERERGERSFNPNNSQSKRLNYP